MKTGPTTRTRPTTRTIRTAAAVAVTTAALALSAAGPVAARASEPTPPRISAVAIKDPDGGARPEVAAGAAAAEWRLCMYLGGHPTLQTGSTGEAVRHLQCILNEVYRYVNVPVSGVFEAVTKASVEHLQRQFALPVTGVVDAATWSALHP
ncbi:peptidoglycan-binding domain-containing protein [Streptomyces sp. NRRL S-920]|uniref:peptidoglycan-binding domain-containing protein n=1 Tax=Streptomyces sp. NRRL S-920 TaxID=1463921 RepID=UPI00068EDD26|nr:peptidoglycan-binding domain-containing protein [Streptomyces sp. NRRL S-920]